MKRKALVVLLFGMLVISLVACSSTESSEETKEAQEEEEETEDNELVNTCLPELAEQIGKMTYDEAIEYIEKTGAAFEAVEPSDDDLGSITTEDDENGFHMSLWIYPDDDDNWTLTLVTYGNGNYEGSISDNYHMGDITYKIYNIYEEEKNQEVRSLDDVLSFLNDEVPLLIEEHKNDGEGKEDIDVTFNVTDQAEDDGVIFTIETNLPTGTELSLSLEGEDYIGQSSVTVEDGKAISGLFSDNGDPLKGSFTLSVTSVTATLQPEEVQDVIGVKGEYLTGDLVSEGVSGNNASAEFNFSF